MSIESLRFMMGGKIVRSTSTDSVWVRHTEEVVAKNNNNSVIVPLPKDHITGTTVNSITASAAHPIRLINLTTGARTQLTAGTFDGTKNILFHNLAMGVGTETPGSGDTITKTYVEAQAGDRIRIFWEEAVTTEDAAVEVTISPSTFPGTLKNKRWGSIAG